MRRPGALRDAGWILPEQLEPYRDLIGETGGNAIEDLLTQELDMRTNMPVTVLAIAVAAQVTLLARLHAQGALTPGYPSGEEAIRRQ
jgi:hypothetical protein